MWTTNHHTVKFSNTKRKAEPNRNTRGRIKDVTTAERDRKAIHFEHNLT